MQRRISSAVAVLLALAAARAVAQTQIATIEINQAIGIQKDNARKFVAGKDTVVRAFLTAAVPVDESQTRAQVSRNGNVVTTLPPATYDVPTNVVDFRCPSREACGKWAAGSYTFDVVVNGVSRSTAGLAYDFVERAEMRILVVPVKANYRGTSVALANENWKSFAEYVRKTYPIAADKLVWVIREEFDATEAKYDLETDEGRYNLWESLAKLIPGHCANDPREEGCYQQVFGFVNDRAKGYPNGTLQGYTYGKPANIGVATDEDAPATVAHEIAHTYGLGDTYDGGSFHCAVNPAPDEFTGKDFNDGTTTVSCKTGKTALPGVSGTKISVDVHPYEVGGRGALPDMAEYMGSGGAQAQFWTTQEGYDWLFDKLAPPPASANRATEVNGGAEQRFIEAFGLIRQNAAAPNDIALDPWWSFVDTDIPPSTTGRYMVAAVNAAGVQLATTAFEPDFEIPGPKGLPPQHVDPAPFHAVVAFPTGTTKFQIIRDGRVLREVPVSPNAPVLTSVAPQLSGTKNEPTTITWSASDADADTLSYEIEYNADVTRPESEWQVIESDLTERTYTLDFDQFPGGAHARVRIWATDGMNATFAESGEFVVPAKAPEVYIDDDIETVVLAGHPVELNGGAIDLQDGELDDAQLQWSSNISGTLGKGWSIVVPSLPAGRHTVTLTATNSAGIRSSESVTIDVITGIRRRAAGGR